MERAAVGARHSTARQRAVPLRRYTQHVAITLDIGAFLDSDPSYWEGRPFIRGKRVTVHRIAIAHSQGRAVEEICDDYDLEPAEVHAALTLYFANREAIDADIDAYDAESERMANATSR